jgi:hypothetical protein
VNLLDSTKRHLAAKPMLLPYPRMYVRRLSGEFSRAIGMDSQLSLSTSGTCTNDLLNLPDNRMKNILASGFFLVTLFLAADYIYRINMEQL